MTQRSCLTPRNFGGYAPMHGSQGGWTPFHPPDVGKGARIRDKRRTTPSPRLWNSASRTCRRGDGPHLPRGARALVASAGVPPPRSPVAVVGMLSEVVADCGWCDGPVRPLRLTRSRTMRRSDEPPPDRRTTGRALASREGLDLREDQERRDSEGPLPGRYYRYRLDVIEAFERGECSRKTHLRRSHEPG